MRALSTLFNLAKAPQQLWGKGDSVFNSLTNNQQGHLVGATRRVVPTKPNNARDLCNHLQP